MGINMNYGGIRKEDHTNVRQILFDVKNQTSVSIRVADTGLVAVDGKKILRAGTPLAGNLRNRAVAFKKAATTDSGTLGVYTVQITTAFTAGEKITIEGVAYEHAAAEDIAAKKFTGTTAAQQVTSLLKMVVTEAFTVAAVSGATDKLGFTQKIGTTNDAPTVTKTSTTGVIGAVTEVTAGATGVVSSDAVGVLLHDVDLTNDSTVNATLLIWGFVNLDRIEAATRALVDVYAIAALLPRITFLCDH